MGLLKKLGIFTSILTLALLAMLIGPDLFHVLDAPRMNKERVSRIKAVLSGDYIPKGLTDVYYDRT